MIWLKLDLLRKKKNAFQLQTSESVSFFKNPNTVVWTLSGTSTETHWIMEATQVASQVLEHNIIYLL